MKQRNRKKQIDKVFSDAFIRKTAANQPLQWWQPWQSIATELYESIYTEDFDALLAEADEIMQNIGFEPGRDRFKHSKK